MIVSDEQKRSGRPVIAGTGICVSDIVVYHVFDRQRPEALAAGFGLTLGQVHAALAYYYMHQTEIDTEMRVSSAESRRSADELKKQGKLITLD
ncbi:MAG: DUF433 domain-containing protein [Chloroflexota bacterium]